MKLLQRLFRPRAETRTLPSVPDQVGIFSTGAYHDTGVAVNEMTALAASAVYACVSVISQGIAALPVHVHQRDDGAKVYDHAVYRLLALEPNEYQTAPAYIETMLVALLLWGNCYSFIERDELGRPIALLPLRADRTRPVRTPAGQLVYMTTVNGHSATLSPADVFHVANLSIDGITGLSPIQQAKQAVGLSLALERFAARFFGQGCHAGGVLTVPSLKSEGMKEFARKFRENYAGPENSWKVAVLENGMTYQPTTVDPEKSQALGQRVHQLREVARIYRVPPHKIGDLERATFSNIEHQALEFVTDCLLPWVRKFEAEAQRKLFLESEKPTLELKFNLDALLRADVKTRFSAHAIALNSGFATVNEVRARENMPPVKGGDVLRAPLNMAPAAPAPKADDTAARSLIEDAARRVLTKEAKALVRAGKKLAGKPDELRAWADSFYTTHAPLVARVMTPVLKAAGLDTDANQYATDHCAQSIRAIAAAVEAGADVQDVADELTDIRPADVVDSLTRKG
jgi:HK97 family phage portal protein